VPSWQKKVISMLPYEIIAKKRDGFRLTESEIEFMVSGFNNNHIPPYQMSAFLMAAYLKGLDKKETLEMTRSMLESGKIMNFSSLEKPVIDKHSTGGVGDKVSIVLAPLAACGGLIVPMACGRGLGHTGGTVDKLESIPGFNTQISSANLKKQIEKIGVAIIGQTPELAPADGKMYALRDVTGTVESIELTSASIMSKKLAEGIDGLVLDVKVGSGAFMKTREHAEKLARTMIDIGTGMGKKVTAIITDMNQPLGTTAGNILEIKECIDVLKNKGPADTKEITLILTGHMFYIAGKVKTPTEGKLLAKTLLENGSAYDKFIEIVKLQDGDTSFIENPSKFPQAKKKIEIKAAKSGYISKMETQQLGIACNSLGAGRITLETPIDFTAGIVFLRKIGNKVKKGEPIAVAHTNIKEHEDIILRVQDAITITGTKPKVPSLVHRVI